MMVFRAKGSLFAGAAFFIFKTRREEPIKLCIAEKTSVAQACATFICISGDACIVPVTIKLT